MNASASSGGDRWFTSTISRRPSTLADHTYGGPVGYIYFDVFSRSSVSDPPKVSMMSRTMEQKSGRDQTGPTCLTFWFAPIGSDPETFLTINRENVDASGNTQDSRTNPPVPVSVCF